jgi:hypothetical protein
MSIVKLKDHNISIVKPEGRMSIVKLESHMSIVKPEDGNKSIVKV